MIPVTDIVVFPSSRPPGHAQTNNEEMKINIEGLVHGGIESVLHLDAPRESTGHPTHNSQYEEMPHCSLLLVIIAQPKMRLQFYIDMA